MRRCAGAGSAPGAIGLVLVFLLVATPVWGDTLGEATTMDFYSSSHSFRVRIEPTLEIAVAERDSSGYQERWRSRFDAPLYPTDALVTDDGKYALTICRSVMGSQRKVISVFGAGGTLIRAIDLDDLFTSAEKDDLARSVSGIAWAAQVFLDPAAPILKIRPRFSSADGEHPGPTGFERLVVSLPTGTVSRE